MLHSYIQGFAIGLSLILAIGAQNAFVLKQGLKKQHVFWVCLVCALSDSLLILLGVLGFSQLIQSHADLIVWAKYFGVAFLLLYGTQHFYQAIRHSESLVPDEKQASSVLKIILICLAFTWLNPHVYLDTFVVLGSLGGQLDVEPKRWFALGTISASFLWFFGLAILAAWLAPRLRTAKSQRIINLVVGCVMWFIALQLARDGIAHAQALFS